MLTQAAKKTKSSMTKKIVTSTLCPNSRSPSKIKLKIAMTRWEPSTFSNKKNQNSLETKSNLSSSLCFRLVYRQKLSHSKARWSITTWYSRSMKCTKPPLTKTTNTAYSHLPKCYHIKTKSSLSKTSLSGLI